METILFKRTPSSHEGLPDYDISGKFLIDSNPQLQYGCGEQILVDMDKVTDELQNEHSILSMPNVPKSQSAPAKMAVNCQFDLLECEPKTLWFDDFRIDHFASQSDGMTPENELSLIIRNETEL